MAEFERGSSHPELADIEQPNRYGIDETNYTPAPQGRSYDSFERGGVSREVQSGTPITAARDALGSPVALNALQAGTIVTVEGIGSMRYDSAVQAGFVNPAQVAQVAGLASAPAQAPVTPTPHEASLVTPPAPQDAQEATEAAQEAPEGGESLTGNHAEAEAAIDAFAAQASESLQVNLIESAASGEISDGLMAEAAEIVGGAEKVEAVKAGFEDQARQAIAEATGLHGDDLQELIIDLYQDHPEAMANAIRQHLGQRSTAAYRELAAQAMLTITTP